jgi:flagellin-like hook-associated protein FlgL
MSNTVMSASIRANLLSLQNTTAMMDKTQLHLSTGKKVNSPLDDAVAFFAAKSLTDRAGDLNKLLDAMGQSISGINQASTGVTGVTKLVDQANAIASQARDAMAKGAQEAKVAGTVDLKGVQDLTTKPGISATSQLTFTVIDKDGTTVINAQNIAVAAGDSTEQLVTKINDLNASLSSPAIEAKINDAGKLEIKALDGSNFSLKFTGDTGTPTTAEDLAFAQALGFGDSAKQVANGTLTGAVQNYDVMISAKADSSLTSNALYSAANTLAKASDTLSSLFTNSAASTNLVTGTVDAGDQIRVGVNGGTLKNYAITGLTVQGLVDKINTDFEGTLAASFDATTGQINIRSTDAKVQTVEFGVYDETTTNAMTTRFGFGIASALTATAGGAGEDALNVESIRLGSAAADLATFESDYNKIRDQIDSLVKDAGYRGTNLLNGDTLMTVFNEDRSTSISTKGAVLTSAGLGLNAANFANAASVDTSLTEIRGATSTLRSFASSLANDLNVIQTRQDFTKQTVNTLQEGSDKLTVADPNEEGATMLALQTRQQLAVQALSLASQAQQSVLSLLR